MKQFWLCTLKQCVTQFQTLLATVQEQYCLSRHQMRDKPISIPEGSFNNFCLTVDLETALSNVPVGTSTCHGRRHALQPKKQNFRTLYWLWNLKQPSVSVQPIFQPLWLGANPVYLRSCPPGNHASSHTW